MIFFGTALHLSGDIFAHKTIVTNYTIAGVNGSETSKNSNGQYMFGTKYFNKSSAFEDTSAVRNAIKTVCKKNSMTSLSQEQLNGINDSTVRYWQYFQLGVALQVMEFRDINMFLSNSYSGAKNPYEDNASFCQERYTAALNACRKLADRAYRNVNFYIGAIFPKVLTGTTEQNQKYSNVKLNNFYAYANVSNLSMYPDGITQSDWDAHSTNTLV